MTIPESAHYRQAEDQAESCATCGYFSDSNCTMWAAPVAEQATCDQWEVKVAKAEAGTLYLIRHGKTLLNSTGPEDRIRGWLDIPLDRDGMREARSDGEALKTAGLHKLYTSDLARADSSAVIIGRILGLQPTVTRALRPWGLGDFEGQPSIDCLPELRKYAVRHPELAVPNGESFRTFAERFLKAFESLLGEAESGTTLGVVTHYRDIKLAEAWLAGGRKRIDMSAFFSDDLLPGTIIKISRAADGSWGYERLVSVEKAEPLELQLMVVGVQKGAQGFVYRTASGDGHYVGRTEPTEIEMAEGDTVRVRPRGFRAGVNSFEWALPQVVGKAEGRALTRRALVKLTKDAPANGNGGVGPTLSSVHVNAPLRDISVFYGANGPRPYRSRLRYEVRKVDKQAQIAYGVVLEPDTVDSQDDVANEQEIEQAAHGYMRKALRGRSSVTKLQHRRQAFFRDKPSVIPVESFIAPVDFSYDGKEWVRKGSWVLALHFENARDWQDVLDGKFGGLSAGGSGSRMQVAAVPAVQKEEVEEEASPPPGGAIAGGVLERLTSAFENLAKGGAEEKSRDVVLERLVGAFAEQSEAQATGITELARSIRAEQVSKRQRERQMKPTQVIVKAPDVHIGPGAFHADVHVPEMKPADVRVTVQPPRPRPMRVEVSADGSKRYIPEED